MSDWIEWTWSTEKPYPETLDTTVDVRFRDGDIVKGWQVCNWDGPGEFFSNWYCAGADADIVAYRVVE